MSLPHDLGDRYVPVPTSPTDTYTSADNSPAAYQQMVEMTPMTDKITKELRTDLAWLLYGWTRPAGDGIPDELPTIEFALWDVKARGILSLIADKLDAAGHRQAATVLAGDRSEPEPQCEHTSPLGRV